MRKVATLLITLLCVNLALAHSKLLECQEAAAAGLKQENGQWKANHLILKKFFLELNGDTLTKESVMSAHPDQNEGMKVFTPLVSCITSSVTGVIKCSLYGEYTLTFDPKSNRGGTSDIGGARYADRESVQVRVFTCQPGLPRLSR
jgi:hypothetical protein